MKNPVIVTIVLCFILVGMLSGCVNPLDTKEQFIGVWRFVGTEEESIMDIAATQDVTQLWIFYRNNTLEIRFMYAGGTGSIFTTYRITSDYLILTEPGRTEEVSFSYVFPDADTLILTTDYGSSGTFIRANGG